MKSYQYEIIIMHEIVVPFKIIILEDGCISGYIQLFEESLRNSQVVNNIEFMPNLWVKLVIFFNWLPQVKLSQKVCITI